jgi:glycosyltransferase involved in cell wall biosynthesis
MNNKLLIYSDCPIYGGCENLITNLLNSFELNNSYNIVFVYRYSKIYDNEFKRLNNKLGKVILNPIILPIFDSDYYLFTQKKMTKNIYRLKILINKISLFSGFSFLYILVYSFYLILKLKPNLIHINNGGYPASFSARIFSFVAGLLKKPVVMTINNLAQMQNNKFEKYYDYLISSSVNYFVTASRYASNILKKNRSFENSKFDVIPNAVFPFNSKSKLHEYKSVINFGCVGLLTHRKGFNIAIEAVALLKNKYSNFHLYIFGEGEELINLNNLINQYLLTEFVTLCGFVEDKNEIYGSIDVLVCPSLMNEDMPYVIIEAAANNIPCIGSNVAGIPEVIGIDGGFVFEANDFMMLANHMEKYLHNNNLYVNQGMAAYSNYLDIFTVDSVVSRYIRMYDGLLLN